MFNSTGTVIARSTNGDTKPDVIWLDPPLAAGTYYVLVYRVQRRQTPNYNLTLTRARISLSTQYVTCQYPPGNPRVAIIGVSSLFVEKRTDTNNPRHQ